LNEGIFTGTDALSASCVYIEQNIHALFQMGQHIGFEGSVKATMDFRVLEKIAQRDMRLELRVRHKKIIYTMHFAGARQAGRAGDGVNEISLLAQGADEGGLARAGWGGDDEENSGAGDGEIIQCWQVVRGSCPARSSHR